MTRTRLLATLFLLVAALSLSGQAPQPDVREGEALYLLVLGNTSTDPDIAALGGRLLHSSAGRRMVAAPPESLHALRAMEGVSYVQRIWTGEAMDGAPPRRSRGIAADQVTVRPSWETGIYSYDDSGNISDIGDDSYSYDPVGRLTAAAVRGETQSYTYDPYGNLRKLGGNVLCVEAGTNRLGTLFTSGDSSACDDPARPIHYRYDDTGNLTVDAKGRRYHYDAIGMVTAIDVAAQETTGDLRMIYTADDERIVLAEGSSVTRYRVRDLGARVLREWKSTGGLLEWERDYVYAGGALVAGEVQVDKELNPLRHYHADHLGSIRMVTDGSGQLVARHDYLPFGAEIKPTTTEYTNTGKGPRDPLKFTGHERDYLSVANSEGEYLDYMHARYYTAGAGRFLTVDPGRDWDISKPQSWNTYTYVRNNPINARDPDGRAVDVLLDAGSAAYGIGVMWKKALRGEPVTWRDNAAVLVDIGSAFVPGLTGGGTVIRAASKAEAVVDLARSADNSKSIVQRGSRNPKVADAARKGQEAHKAAEYPSGFKKEVKLPSGKRMDAYNAETKEVIELKPNNPAAVKKGQKQVEQYCKECDEVYGPGHKGTVRTYERQE